MIDLKKLDDRTLIQELQALVAEERRISTAILWHLAEVQKRRLFSDLGFGSLFEYCIRGLGYSESAAQRRIEAMRLLRELPELEDKIQSGELSLSVAAQAGTFFRQESKLAKPVDLETKREILKNLEGKSSRQAQRELIQISSQPPQVQERTRPLPDQQTEIRLVADAELMDQLEKIKGLLAHQYPNMSWAELVRYMAEQTMKKLEPTPKKSEPLPASEVKVTANRYIPMAIRRAVWTRDQGKCVQCGSRHALQFDHRVLFSMGGGNTLENLQLVCRNCNQRRAILSLGLRKMQLYLKSRL